MNKNYVKGRSFEYELMSDYEKQGFYCIRSAGSHKLADIVAIPTKKALGVDPHITRVVQCKAYKPSRIEVLQFLEEAKDLQAIPVLAFKQKVKNKKRKIKIILEGREEIAQFFKLAHLL